MEGAFGAGLLECQPLDTLFRRKRHARLSTVNTHTFYLKMLGPQSYSRHREPFYTRSMFVAEYLNTWSNAFFILLAIARLKEELIQQSPLLVQLHYMMIAIGIGSAIHHGLPYRWTLIFDYVPIGYALYQVFWCHSLYLYFSYASWLKALLSVGVLVDDHIYRRIPNPWGHVMWHVLAAFTMDSAFQDVLFYLYN
jgi:hypothetical protein